MNDPYQTCQRCDQPTRETQTLDGRDVCDKCAAIIRAENEERANHEFESYDQPRPLVGTGEP